MAHPPRFCVKFYFSFLQNYIHNAFGFWETHKVPGSMVSTERNVLCLRRTRHKKILLVPPENQCTIHTPCGWSVAFSVTVILAQTCS